MDIGDMILKITSEINKFMDKWNITLIAIASISLIVGGIGLFSTYSSAFKKEGLKLAFAKALELQNRISFSILFLKHWLWLLQELL